MEEQREAVILLLSQLSKESREWFRNANTSDISFFVNRIPGNFTFDDGNCIYKIRKNSGSFPKRKILSVKSYVKEKPAVVGFWLRWNFTKEPIEFRLFLGFWYESSGKIKFNGYRFDAPEIGCDHNYFHCQPCRNFGDSRTSLEGAALVSEKFPTIPINASNIVELTVCALMATRGRKRMERFLRGFFMRPEGRGNVFLWRAYLRCCKDKNVQLPL